MLLKGPGGDACESLGVYHRPQPVWGRSRVAAAFARRARAR